MKTDLSNDKDTPSTKPIHPEIKTPADQPLAAPNPYASPPPHPPSQIPYPRIIALLLFMVALLPRLPGLGRFLTSDENTNIFFAGSDVIAAFLRGDFRGTYWHFYPGVTMSWLDAIGLAGQYWLDAATGVATPPFLEYIYNDILNLVVAARLPYAILTAAAVPATYLLARQLLPQRVALLGALFLAFDPFFLAHSRVAHGDAPVAVFMSLSALAFFIYTEKRLVSGLTHPIPTGPAETRPTPPHPKRSLIADISTMIRQRSFIYLILSAILGSLAALTKAPGPFIALFIIAIAIIYAIIDLKQAHQQSPQPPTPIPYLPSQIALWGLIALVVYVLLWPSMWVDPINTLTRLWHETFTKVDEGHLVYFFGRPTLDPGFWFYFYVIPFRLTPIILIGSIISLILLTIRTNSQFTIHNSQFRIIFFLWFFTISLLLFGNLSPKKQDRYLLPLFPFLNLLAAIGWLGLIDLTRHFIQTKFQPSSNYQLSIINYQLPILLILLLHLLPTFTYYPYYLAYFNPLLGGPQRAVETTLMGWGEGMEQVGAYLNTKPNATDLYVASTPSQTLLPYFAGTGENFYTNDIAFRADYVVLYLAQMQRLAPSPDIVHYFEAQQPEKIITIKTIPYAKIYRGPKLILLDIPPDATPLNIGLEDTMRLAGYHIANLKSPQLTLYWHALKSPTANYTISVRVRAADDRLLAQHDSWPVDGLLPTSQWRQGDYVTDIHTIDSPAPDAKIDTFEIVVYNQETGQTLGPPIQLAINN